jgi:hypothetical protein
VLSKQTTARASQLYTYTLLGTPWVLNHAILHQKISHYVCTASIAHSPDSTQHLALVHTKEQPGSRTPGPVQTKKLAHCTSLNAGPSAVPSLTTRLENGKCSIHTLSPNHTRLRCFCWVAKSTVQPTAAYQRSRATNGAKKGNKISSQEDIHRSICISLHLYLHSRNISSGQGQGWMLHMHTVPQPHTFVVCFSWVAQSTVQPTLPWRSP